MAPRGDMTQWLGSRVLRCRFSFFWRANLIKEISRIFDWNWKVIYIERISAQLNQQMRAASVAMVSVLRFHL